MDEIDRGELRQRSLPTLVVDANILIRDACHRSEDPRGSALRRVIGDGHLAVCVTPEVISEVEAHLPRVASRRGRDPGTALALWHDDYRPRIAIRTERPAHSECADPRITALAVRDSDDVPTAELALALRCAAIISDDLDLVETGLAHEEWLDVIFAAERTGQVLLAIEIGLELGEQGSMWIRDRLRDVSSTLGGQLLLGALALTAAALAVHFRSALRRVSATGLSSILALAMEAGAPIAVLHDATAVTASLDTEATFGT